MTPEKWRRSTDFGILTSKRCKTMTRRSFRLISHRWSADMMYFQFPHNISHIHVDITWTIISLRARSELNHLAHIRMILCHWLLFWCTPTCISLIHSLWCNALCVIVVNTHYECVDIYIKLRLTQSALMYCTHNINTQQTNYYYQAAHAYIDAHLDTHVDT